MYFGIDDYLRPIIRQCAKLQYNPKQSSGAIIVGDLKEPNDKTEYEKERGGKEKWPNKTINVAKRRILLLPLTSSAPDEK